MEEEILQEKETKTSIDQLIRSAYHHNYAIAAWKDSHNGLIHVVIDLSENYKKPVDPELEKIGSGFMVSPFFNESNHLCYLIRADVHYCGKNEEQLKRRYDHTSIPGKDAGIFLNEIEVSQSEDQFHPNYHLVEDYGQEENSFKELVRRAIVGIEKGEFQKVVPSRRQLIDLKEEFSLAGTFLELTRNFPEAFVSFFSIPGKGTWLGASPEILIDIDGNGIFRTTAVAGTQLCSPEVKLSTVAWTQKEIEEQALVSRYIINNFKKIRLREFDESGPKTVRAGNLVHLRTDFIVNIHDVNFPQLGTVMLKLLHPTSAVCGMPKEPSLEFLRKFENYDREFYSGFLGPVNVDRRTTLHVNLRCAQLMDKKAYLYSGAGVTLDSDPEQEWNETIIKNQAMKMILRKNS